MAAFRRAGDERVNVFEVDERYLFKHYFDSDEVFDRLKQYYNNQHYRFEVPPNDFEALRSFLAEHGYGLVVVSAIDEFVVVVEKYTSHPENIFNYCRGGVPFLKESFERASLSRDHENLRFSDDNAATSGSAYRSREEPTTTNHEVSSALH